MNISNHLCQNNEDFHNRVKEFEESIDYGIRDEGYLNNISDFIQINKALFFEKKHIFLFFKAIDAERGQADTIEKGYSGELPRNICQILPKNKNQGKIFLQFMRSFIKDSSERFQAIADCMSLMKLSFSDLNLVEEEVAGVLLSLESMDLTHQHFDSFDLKLLTAALLKPNLQFKTKDLSILNLLALLCAQGDAEKTAQFIQNFQIEDPSVRAEIARLCAKKNGRSTARYIQNFQIEDPSVRAEIALLCAQQNAGGTARYIQNFQIEDEGRRADIARLCAQQDGEGTARNIQDFQIEDPSVMAEIARLCAKQNGRGTAQFIQNFHIADPNVRAEIACLCAQQNDGATAELIQNFQIRDQSKLADIACFCAKQNGGRTAELIQTFQIKDQNRLVEIACFCAKQNGGRTAKLIKKFQIQDQGSLTKIARLCAQQDGGETAKYIRKFQIADPGVRVEIACLCAQQNGIATAEYIKEFQIEDQGRLAEIARLCAKKNGGGTALFIQSFQIADLNVRAEIARLCAQQDGAGTAQWILNFHIADPKMRAEIACLCAQQDGKKTAHFIKEFEIKEISSLQEIFLHCINSNYQSLFLLENFSPLFNEAKELCQQLQILKDKRPEEVISKELFIEINHLIKQLPISELHREYFLKGSKDIQDLSPHAQQVAIVWFIVSMLRIKTIETEAIEWMVDQGMWSELSLLRDPNLRMSLSEGLYELSRDKTAREFWEKWLPSARSGIEGKRGMMLLAIPFYRLQKEGMNPIRLLEIANQLITYRKDNETSLRSVYHIKNLLFVLHALAWNKGYPAEKKIAGIDKIFSPKEEKQILKNIIVVKGLVQLKDFDWTAASEDLSVRFRVLLEKVIPLGDYKGNVTKKYDKIFGNCRSPIGLLTYAAGLKSLNEPVLMTCLGQYVVSVLEGTFKERRYETVHNPHLSKISEKHPGLIEKWSKEWSLDLEALSSNETQPEAFSPLKWLEKNLVTDKHLGETPLPYVTDYLKASPSEKTEVFKNLIAQINSERKEEEKKQLRADILKCKKTIKNLNEKIRQNQHLKVQLNSEKKAFESKIAELKEELSGLSNKVNVDPHLALLNLQKACLTFIKMDQGENKSALIGLLEEINKALHQKKTLDPVFDMTEFAKDVKGLIESFTDKIKAKKGLKIVLTDDPIDFLVCGSDVNSCLSLDGTPDLNKGLLGYFMDGKNRLLAVKDGDKIISRSLLRLLWDGEQAVVYRERFYPNSIPANHKEGLNRLAKLVAQELGIPCTCYEEGTAYGKPLQALGSHVPYEYCDGSGGGIKRKGYYTIQNAKRMD